MKRNIYFRTSPSAEWKVYTTIISTLEDAKKACEFLKTLGTGFEFKLEEDAK